ncbi:MAG: right-handed parallel beta-helix repeat-containing protein [bacterium]
MTTTNDENSSTPPNVVCALREAIIAANTDAPVGACPAGSKGTDTIALPKGKYLLTIAGTGEDAAQTGDLDILDDVVIQGVGADLAIIEGNGIDRVFHVIAGATGSVQFSGVTIRGGAPEGIYDSSGAISVVSSIVEANAGAGISATDPTTIASSTLRDNGDAAIFLSLAYFESSSITDSLVENNASPNNAAVSAFSGIVTITRTTVRGNNALYGAIVVGGSGTIVDSTIEGNGSVTTSFGAVNTACIGWTCSSSLDISGSTISGNQSDGLVLGRAYATVKNSTISGNTGRGAYIISSSVDLVHVTIAKNTGLALDNENGGIFGPADTRLANTILSDGGCVNVASTLTSLGGNVESPGNTCLLTDPSDQPGVASAGLVALGMAGGLTKTHALSPSSPAVGAGLAANCLATDQRGIARPAPSGGNCDSGAYELTGCGASLSGAGLVLPAVVLHRRRRRRSAT